MDSTSVRDDMIHTGREVVGVEDRGLNEYCPRNRLQKEASRPDESSVDGKVIGKPNGDSWQSHQSNNADQVGVARQRCGEAAILVLQATLGDRCKCCFEYQNPDAPSRKSFPVASL